MGAILVKGSGLFEKERRKKNTSGQTQVEPREKNIYRW